MSQEQEAIGNYIKETQAKIDDLIEECRTKEKQVEGFGHQFLEQITRENPGIPESVIKGIKKCIDDPEATCVLKMNPIPDPLKEAYKKEME